MMEMTEMTELGSIYNHNGKQSTASTQSRQIAEKFASAIGEFNFNVESKAFIIDAGKEL